MPESAVSGTNVVMPTSGRLLVMADVDQGIQVSVDCTPNATPTFGMYVEAIPVQGTSRTGADGVGEPYHVTGVTGVLAAGTHLVNYGAACAGASTPGIFSVDTNRSTVAVLLGTG